MQSGKNYKQCIVMKFNLLCLVLLLCHFFLRLFCIFTFNFQVCFLPLLTSLPLCLCAVPKVNGMLSYHYNDVIMGMIASQITSLTIVYSTDYSDADQRKYQSYASLASVRGIHRRLMNSTHKWPVMRKIFQFDDVIKWFIHVTSHICSWRMLVAWLHDTIHKLPGTGSSIPLHSELMNFTYWWFSARLQ